MLLSILLGILIFGYAGFTIFRFVKKSKQGKCATCSMKKGCQSACSDVTESKAAFNNYTK
ncbi:radical SAM additional 4Fe4S-binding SPASM domain-containing protein [Fictibacillus solisalsi]|uniref:Radical SAM additional 4Fe4S-binding SPASM domain-containing protein n=1 Tax=Fictibacillus solisalsi TaxID=459525 RepID=A0A1H0ARH2_9BACL|nr:FeoB-associated Cys-rich membrane protein [Fictibacillus solisalsi]SDN35673.1 radical SAM additional 4Fe4S-binding SPASM domain-containing protein [Fictibacillus solisalsi]